MPSKSLLSLLIISASLSLAVITIIPVYHQASAKDCSNNDDDSSCSNNHDSNSNSNDDDHNNKHSNSDDNNDDGNNAKKDKTPFVLSTPVPFP